MGCDLYFRIFLNIISTIGVMIHNEIVVINICNLGSDTKYFLDLEVKNEDLENLKKKVDELENTQERENPNPISDEIKEKVTKNIRIEKKDLETDDAKEDKNNEEVDANE